MRGIICAVLMSLPGFTALSQTGQADDNSYPQTYFRNPLDIPIFLAGNFGECRPGHFHSGVDIKTLGKENQPVHAAADGYISRIKMEKGGFGHALYITHANGYTTLYAHLNDFAPAIQKYLRKEQYDRKRWDVDLSLTPSEFPVKKGQLIAYSGNTGASTAPHLHFEIRDNKTEHPLNPELFGLPITDKIAPLPADVAVYDVSRSIYEQEPVIVSLARKEGLYRPARCVTAPGSLKGDTIFAGSNELGVGVNVDDFMDGSDNTIAFLYAELYLDGALQTRIKLDDIGYDVSRYVNAYADYKTKEKLGMWLQCFFRLPGNRLTTIYPFLNNDNGRLNVTSDKPHEIRIRITDDRNNAATVLFYVKPTGGAGPATTKSLPAAKFKANQANGFATPNLSFSLDERQLYDDVDFVFDSSKDPDVYSCRFRVHYPFVPVHHFFDLSILPNRTIPADKKGKVAVMYSDGKETDGRAASETGEGWFKAPVRNFGTYWLDIDTDPPVIKPLQKGASMKAAKEIAFEVKDDMTSVKSFSGSIDGKWVCFEQHGSRFFYRFDEHCGKGKHRLVFRAADENGNETSYTLDFTR